MEKQIESYHISKSEYGIVTLIINTRDKGLSYYSEESLDRFKITVFEPILEEDEMRDSIVIQQSDLQLDKKKEYSYLKLDQQCKDQIIFYWIPLRLLRGDICVNSLINKKNESNI